MLSDIKPYKLTELLVSRTATSLDRPKMTNFHTCGGDLASTSRPLPVSLDLSGFDYSRGLCSPLSISRAYLILLRGQYYGRARA